MSSNCEYGKSEEEFVWSLLCLCFIKKSWYEAKELVASMFDQDFDFACENEKILLEFWEHGQCDCLIDLALKELKQQSFDIERHVLLVSSLVDNKKLSVNDASLLLDYKVSLNSNNIRESIRNIFQINFPSFMN